MSSQNKPSSDRSQASRQADVRKLCLVWRC